MPNPTDKFTNFQSQVSFLSGYYNDAEGTSLDTEFSAINTWVDLVMGGTIVSDSNTISPNLDSGLFTTTAVGKYFLQFIFTFVGSASAVYGLRCTLNDNPISYSNIVFSTRGTNVKWEVAQTLIIDCGYNNIIDNPSGLYSSKNKIGFQAQNTTGTGSLDLENLLFNIIKID